ncbi:PspA-associated protein PspAB [Methanococcoides methylutens]|uniref:PspA-associated protein PspAB n=1 Tax=Methanococcoides methylutens TaxID=2226 RepID=UPI004044D9E5
MGLKGMFDSLLGRSKLPESNTDRLFSISTAVVTMEVTLNLHPSGQAGICFKSMSLSQYENTRKEIEELLSYSTKETGTKFHIEKDKYNFLWVVLDDADFEDLVTNIHMISQTLIEQGFSEQILCAVYRFESEGPVYWIYSFKQGNYYPFVPRDKQERDNSMEIRLKSLIENELPVEKNVEKWYPLWGMPF